MEIQWIVIVFTVSVLAYTGGHAQSLNGRTLEITTIPSPPFMIVGSNSSRYGSTYSGYFVDVIQKLSSLANFSYNFHVVYDKKYGSESNTGVWNGMIGEIVNDVADIAVAPLTIAATRANAVQFTQPIIDAGLRILYRKTSAAELTPSIAMLLSPFSAGLWFMIFVCVAVASLSFMAIGKVSPFESTPENTTVGENVPIVTTLANAFVYTISSFFHQEYSAVPRSAAARVLSIFWWMFATLVVTVFAANFTSVILSQPPDIRTIPFMTFDELSRQNAITFGTINNGYTAFYFANSKRPLQQRMNKKLSNVNSIAEGLSRIRSENYAFILEGPAADFISMQSPCDTLVVGDPLDDRAYGFACSMGSDVCTLLNPFILHLHERGYFVSIRRKWVRSGPCYDPNRRYINARGSPMIDVFKKLGIRLETQLSFGRFSAVLFILLAGAIVSLVVLGAEMLYVSKFGMPGK